jgi:hypothetical protein
MGDIHGQARAESEAPLPVGLPPGRTFAGLVVIIATVSALGLATQRRGEVGPEQRAAAPAEEAPPGAETIPPPAPPARPELSPPAAARVFASLRTDLNRAVQQRDLTGVAGATTPTGSVGSRAVRVVRSLMAENILDLTTIRSVSVRLVRIGPGTAVVRERARLRPCLRTVRGRDVTKAPEVFTQTILWRLRHDGARWLLHRASLVRDRILRDTDARCP